MLDWALAKIIVLAKALIYLYLFRSINATAIQRIRLTDNSEKNPKNLI